MVTVDFGGVGFGVDVLVVLVVGLGVVLLVVAVAVGFGFGEVVLNAEYEDAITISPLAAMATRKEAHIRRRTAPGLAGVTKSSRSAIEGNRSHRRFGGPLHADPVPGRHSEPVH